MFLAHIYLLVLRIRDPKDRFVKGAYVCFYFKKLCYQLFEKRMYDKHNRATTLYPQLYLHRFGQGPRYQCSSENGAN